MPSRELVEEALNAIHRRADYEYFFLHLTSPEWIEPLRASGVFRHPDPPVPREGGVVFPIWPVSQYLLRMAQLESLAVKRLVFEVLLEIPETTNTRVHEDLAEIALRLPPNMARRWAEKESRWVRAQQWLDLLLSNKLGAVISHLANGGEAEAALDLARSLLAVLPGEREKSLSPKPRGRMRDWDYQRVLRKNVPDLVKSAPEPGLRLLCDLLSGAVRSSFRDESEQEPPEDSFLGLAPRRRK